MTGAAFLAVLLAAAGQDRAPVTLRAGAGERFASIGQALQNAGPGDTILVGPGIYPGNLILDRPVVLEGIGRPVIRGERKNSVITVVANGCTIRGFVIERSGGELADEDSGILLKSSGNRVENNELRDVLFGIYFYHADHNVAARNFVRGRAELGLGERGSGIHIWNSSYNVIEDNDVTQTRDGMYLQNAYWSTIRRNRTYNLRYGLHYMFSDDNVFEENLSYDNVAGAAIMYSRRIGFRRNVLLHNRGFSSFGILFQDSQDCVAEQNVVADNAVGIFMESLRASRLERNLIAGNDIAIQAFSSASGNVFRRNNFVENLSPIQVIGRVTDTRWSDGGAGNYWSGYDGYDLDGDGIGDVPYRIQNVFEHLEANHPRVRLYLFSPASQALAFAEKTFPVMEASREVDAAPLMQPVAVGVSVPRIHRAGGGPGCAWLLIPALILVAAAAGIARERAR